MKKTFSFSIPPPFLLLLLAACLTLGSLNASAQNLYRWIDKDGRVIYSDSEPPKDAKDVRQKSSAIMLLQIQTICCRLRSRRPRNAIPSPCLRTAAE